MPSEDGKTEFLIETLRGRIKRGDFGTSGRLPTVTQLSREYQVARDTVHDALQMLRAEGLLLVRNAAYVVNNPILQITKAPNFDQYLEKQGLRPVFEDIVTPEIVTMPTEIAAMFHQAEGLHVVHRVRKQGTFEVPLRIEENWYPADLAAEFLEEMKQNPLLNVAREIRLKHGVAITRIAEDVKARHPTPEETKILEITRTSPVLDARRNFHTDEGITVIYNRTIMVAAFFLLHYEYPTSFQEAQE